MNTTITAAAATQRHTAAILGRWKREPLLHFLVLGGLLYLASQIVTPGDDNMDIVIDAARVDRLAQLYSLQTGTPPSEVERQQLVDDFIREEVLYREALKLGLDDGDEIIRRRLIQKMEFLVASSAKASEPDINALVTYYQAHPARFTTPPWVSFQHVYFSPDKRGTDGARLAALSALTDNGDAQKPLIGDRSPLPDRMEKATATDLQLAFGQRPIVQTLLEAPLGSWSGPVESGFGWHLVRVFERAPSRSPTFDEVRDEVKTAWLINARKQAEKQQVASLVEHYRVIRHSQ